MLKRLFASRKNPYFPTENKLETLSTNLSGTKLSFTCPLPSVPSALPYQKHLTDINIFDHSQYEYLDERNKNLLEHQRGGFPYFSFIKRDWGFWGSLLNSEVIGLIGLSANITHTNTLPKEMTCFNPEHFEQVIMRQLYYSGGPGNLLNEELISPVNWQLIDLDGTQWIDLEIHRKHAPNNPTRQFYTPLDDRHYVRFSFSLSAYSPIENSLAKMHPIIDKVVKSISLDLNPSARSSFIDSKKKWNRASYSKQRELEKWDFFDYDEEFNKYFKLGSQPSKWVF